MAAAPRGRWLQHRAAKPLLFTLCLLPLAWLVYGAATDGLGANPAEALIRATGDWTLRLLCLALAVTPVRIALGVPALARMRRMLGLFTFFYAALHLLCYAWFDMGFDAAEIARDIAKRPFILVGMAAFALLLLLAATSFNRAIRWLGGGAGSACTAPCTWWRCWRCCTSSGCARARTTSPRWRSMPPCWRRCCWRAWSAGGGRDAMG